MRRITILALAVGMLLTVLAVREAPVAETAARKATAIRGFVLPGEIVPGVVARDRFRVTGPRLRTVILQHREPGQRWQSVQHTRTTATRHALVRVKVVRTGDAWAWKARMGKKRWVRVTQSSGDVHEFRVKVPRRGRFKATVTDVERVRVLSPEFPVTGPRIDATAPSPVPDLTPTPDEKYPCVRTDQNGRCSYAAVPYIGGAASDPWVDQNVWTGSTTYTQTLYSASPKDWYIIGNADTNFGGVLTFANTGFHMTGTVRDVTPINSGWSVYFPHDDTTIAWAMYDLWFNNWADEVSIIVDLSVNDSYDCQHVAVADFDGEPWHLCLFGSQRVLKPGRDDNSIRNTPTGSLEITEMILWLEDNGYLPENSTWTASSFGYEVCDTGGVDVKFAVRDFYWTAG